MPPAVESGNLEGATVLLRFDKDPAATHEMSKSTDGEALFFERPKALIAELLDHQSLLFRFTPFNSSPQETSFSLRGLRVAVKALYEACKWSPEQEVAQAQEAQEKARAVMEKWAVDVVEGGIRDLHDPQWITRAHGVKRIREVASGTDSPEKAASEEAVKRIRNEGTVVSAEYGLLRRAPARASFGRDHWLRLQERAARPSQEVRSFRAPQRRQPVG